jgi:hypothetical protein
MFSVCSHFPSCGAVGGDSHKVESRSTSGFRAVGRAGLEPGTSGLSSRAHRERELERVREELRRDRVRAVRKAHSAGIPLTGIGDVLGLSHQRVSDLLHER